MFGFRAGEADRYAVRALPAKLNPVNATPHVIDCRRNLRLETFAVVTLSPPLVVWSK
jgi:hypothetical protein